MQQKVDEVELMKLLAFGGSIKNRTVYGSSLAAVISSTARSDPKLRSERVWIEDCTIRGNFSLKNIDIEAGLVFRRCKFTGNVFFQNVNFSNLVFHESRLTLNTDLKNVTVSGSAIFEGAVFRGRLWLRHVTFKGEAIFAGGENDGDAWFSNVVFSEELCSFELRKFKSWVDFKNLTFAGKVRFDSTDFTGRCTFEDSEFQGESFFSSSNFAEETSFDEVTFRCVARFDRANVRKRVRFYGCTFNQDAVFDYINFGNHGVGALSFCNTEFNGRAAFNRADLEGLDFTDSGDNLAQKGGPVGFAKKVSFRNIFCNSLYFRGTEFSGPVDFYGGRIYESFFLHEVLFQAYVDFGELKIGSYFENDRKPIISLNRVHFNKTTNLRWEQLTPKSIEFIENPIKWLRGASDIELTVSSEESTWQLLEEAFERSGNLKGKNEAHYAYEESKLRYDTLFSLWASRLFWGFGLRPFRLFVWMVLIFCGFTLLYWTQIKSEGSSCLRLWKALHFSWLTSCKLDYGRNHSRSTLFQTITVIHAFGFKILLLLLLYSISNVSPLLHSLVNKLFPV